MRNALTSSPQIARDVNSGLHFQDFGQVSAFDSACRNRILQYAAAGRPTTLLQRELQADAPCVLVEDMKANGVGPGIGRKAIATAASVPGVAGFLNAARIWNHADGLSAALTLIGVAERQARSDGPGAIFRSSRGIEKRASHSTVS